MLEWQLHSDELMLFWYMQRSAMQLDSGVADGADRWSVWNSSPNWQHEQVEKMKKAWGHIIPLPSPFTSQTVALIFKAGFQVCLHTQVWEKRKKNLTHMSGLKAHASAQLDQMCFRITNWNNLFSRFGHCGNVLMEPFIGQALATRLRDLGQYCGCHGHSEGNSPVSRRWMQWQKQDATAILSTTHSRMEGGRGVGQGQTDWDENTLFSSKHHQKWR